MWLSTGTEQRGSPFCHLGAMTSNPREFAELCFEQSGVLTTEQAVRLLGRGVVRGHLRAGRWRRVCRGIVATTNGRLERRQQLWVAVLTAGPGALLGGVTALTEAGVTGLRETSLRVVVPAMRSKSRRLPAFPSDMPRVRVTRTRILPDGHRQVGSPPRTVTARAVVDGAAWAASEAAARTVIAVAFQQRRVSAEDVFEVLDQRWRLPRLGLIKRTVLDVAGGAQALSEIDFAVLCRRARLPDPDRQAVRRDGSGRVRYLDAYWKRWRLLVEVDGSHHLGAQRWAEDMLRQNQVWIEGDRVLRFPAGLIRSRPDVVVGQVRSALEAAGWRD
jgi:very-short-patch-repair endonuclease